MFYFIYQICVLGLCPLLQMLEIKQMIGKMLNVLFHLSDLCARTVSSAADARKLKTNDWKDADVFLKMLILLFLYQICVLGLCHLLQMPENLPNISVFIISVGWGCVIFCRCRTSFSK